MITVNGRYTTVFQSASIGAERKMLQEVNRFSWEDNYRVFTTTKDNDNETVSLPRLHLKQLCIIV
jgi:hypothetical protein